ncbi:MAG: acyl-CoA carboxylase subunit beta [Gemmatimonadales bacterium]
MSPETVSSHEDYQAELRKRKAAGRKADDHPAVQRQHERGKLTARERLDILFDKGSFIELDALVTHRMTSFGMENNKPPGDSVVTGYGTVDGRVVFAYSQDFTVFGGTVSAAAAEKIVKAQDLSLKVGAPIVAMNDSGGARIQAGITGLKGYGDIFLRNVLASGVVPQIAVMAGPTAGGAVYSPAIMDFTYMVEGVGQMAITGPDIVKTVTGEEITMEELGGARTHATKSGVAHFAVQGGEQTLNEVRSLLAFLPSNNMEDAPFVDTGDDPNRRCEQLIEIVPADGKRPYDVREVIEQVVDNGDFLEVHALWARNIVVGFGRMGGRSVGIVGNNPDTMAGSLDIDASRKAARFVRFCDCFNIPLVTLVDVTGYLPGTQQEYAGIITHGAKLLYAYAEATVPKVVVILRKAHGGAYVAMSSKSLRADINVAWPGAEIAVMGSGGAVDLIHRREISAADDPDATRQRLLAEYEEEFYNPYQAASLGFIDDVIDPADTRKVIISSLNMLQEKSDTTPPKKHGNIPL